MQVGRRLGETQRRSPSIHWHRNHAEAVWNVSLARLDVGADGIADPASNPPQPAEFLCNAPASSAPSAGEGRRSVLQADGFGQAGSQAGTQELSLHPVLLHDSQAWRSDSTSAISRQPRTSARSRIPTDTEDCTRYPHHLDVAKVLQRGRRVPDAPHRPPDFSQNPKMGQIDENSPEVGLLAPSTGSPTCPNWTVPSCLR